MAAESAKRITRLDLFPRPQLPLQEKQPQLEGPLQQSRASQESQQLLSKHQLLKQGKNKTLPTAPTEPAYDASESRSPTQLIGKRKRGGQLPKSSDEYLLDYDLDIARGVSIGQEKYGHRNLVAIRRLAGEQGRQEYQNIRDIRGQNIVHFITASICKEHTLVVLEHMPLSLMQIVAAPRPVNEVEVAAIIGQVERFAWPICITDEEQLLRGISSIQSHKQVHGNIDCSTVLLNQFGDVKISIGADLHQLEHEDRTDIDAVAPIMLEVLENTKEGPLKEERSVRAKSFYSEIRSGSVKSLLNHAFLAQWDKKDLYLLVSFAEVSSRRFYDWKP